VLYENLSLLAQSIHLLDDDASVHDVSSYRAALKMYVFFLSWLGKRCSEADLKAEDDSGHPPGAQLAPAAADPPAANSGTCRKWPTIAHAAAQSLHCGRIHPCWQGVTSRWQEGARRAEGSCTAYFSVGRCGRPAEHSERFEGRPHSPYHEAAHWREVHPGCGHMLQPAGAQPRRCTRASQTASVSCGMYAWLWVLHVFLHVAQHIKAWLWGAAHVPPAWLHVAQLVKAWPAWMLAADRPAAAYITCVSSRASHM
jgi:hypothetical protein